MDLKQYIHSDYADSHGIDNTPDQEHIERALLFIKRAVEPLEDLFSPHSINFHSGYRNETLNTALKGKPNSQHKQANALDFDISGYSLEKAYTIIKNSSLHYDQLLLEGKPGHQWIHISYNTDKSFAEQRMQALELPDA